ncbi:MAG TPA: 4-hydroxyphenylacetate 3-hydroxylase N-terminal domain-containing protein [Syntrophales bacterium]|nr:4-hydroxyphenylacetate 3-hydroxylase N-terminal domain-containing protein [Syntrophales bacterium]
MRSEQEYKDSIRAMRPVVYAFGEKVDQVCDHPVFVPTLNAIGLTFKMAKETQNETLMTAKSPFTGMMVNRFLHIMQSPDDLIQRAELSKFFTPFHGACIGARCAGTAALNALYAATYDMDKKLGTDYHQRLVKFITYAQKEDLVVSGAVTDPKGNRALAPSQQADPDLYLRLVEKRADGIVVRGAKAHQSGAALSNFALVAPTLNLRENEKQYAVAFAVPPNAPGIVHIAEAPAPNARRLNNHDEIDFGNFEYGVHGSTHIIFNDVFIPREMVFMCGESEFAGELAAIFGHLQRLASACCKSGHCDLTCGAAAVAADYNGCEKMTHIRDKIVEMSFHSALAYGTALASGYKGKAHASGVYIPDPLLVNAAKLQAVEAVWLGSKLATEITGGIICTIPSQKDFNNPDIAKYVDKYFKGKEDVSTENRARITRLVEYLVGQGSIVPTESSHGAGPAAVQKLIIRQSNNLNYFKERAMKMAGIKK